MENIVYNELLVRGYNVDVGIVDVFVLRPFQPDLQLT